MSTPHTPTNTDFEIAILCALPLEADAAIALLETKYPRRDRASHDRNAYTAGSIGDHYVVIIHMPDMGNINAAAAASDCRASFPSIKLALVVGICGAVPSAPGVQGRDMVDVVLGDVIISSCVIQYDFARKTPGGFETKDTLLDRLGRPPVKIRSTLKMLETHYNRRKMESEMAEYLRDLQQVQYLEAQHPGVQKDMLFEWEYEHIGNKSCNCTTPYDCDCIPHCLDAGCSGKLVERQRLKEGPPQPLIHIGPVASGNWVIKSAADRNELSRKHKAIGFEMESAGVWDSFPCVVIKGVCDYADVHKMKEFQYYAAATAAACTKAFLFEWNPERASTVPGPEIHKVSTSLRKRQGSNSLQQPDPKKRELDTTLVQDCLRSLAFSEMDNRLHGVEDAAAGTCEWLFAHENYTSWAAAQRGILWIKGNPGVGKSTLLRHAWCNSQAMASDPHVLLINFFFHDRGSPLQKTPMGFYRSLLHQGVEKTPVTLQALVQSFEKYKSRNRLEEMECPWHLNELKRLYIAMLQELGQTRSIWLFVDALDESGEESAVEILRQFEEALLPPARPTAQGFAATPPSLHICFSCRHYPVTVSRNAGEMLEICVERENKADIRKFVHSQMERLARNERSEVSNLIAGRASGSFLWASLVLKKVLDFDRQGFFLQDIKNAIEATPLDLKELYFGLLERMKNEATLPDSIKLLLWVCFSLRPLHWIALRTAMAVDVEHPKSMPNLEHNDDDKEAMSRRVVTLSCGLAEVLSHGTVQLIHQTAKEFLIKDGLIDLDGSLAGCLPGKAHVRLATTCQAYPAMKGYCPDYAFEFYQKICWIAHVQKASANGITGDELLDAVRWPSDIVPYNIYFPRKAKGMPPGTSTVLIASEYGIADVLRSIPNIADFLEATDINGNTPIHLAARNSGLKTSLFGVHDLEVPRNFGLETPLFGVHNPEVPRNFGLETPLLGVHDPEVASVLITAGAEVNARNFGLETPLFGVHDPAVANVLITAGAEVNARDKHQKTALFGVRNAEVARVLITAGAEVNARDKHQKTALFGVRNAEVARVLIAAGAEVDARNERGRTPLLVLVMGRWHGVDYHSTTVSTLVKDLMKAGADPQIADLDGNTPLSVLEADFVSLKAPHSEKAQSLLGLIQSDRVAYMERMVLIQGGTGKDGEKMDTDTNEVQSNQGCFETGWS